MFKMSFAQNEAKTWQEIHRQEWRKALYRMSVLRKMPPSHYRQIDWSMEWKIAQECQALCWRKAAAKLDLFQTWGVYDAH